MKRALLIIGVAFAMTAAVVFGMRVSADALAVVIGVILGIAASVPTTLLVIFILTRQRPGLDKGVGPTPSNSPPVVVINTSDRASLAAPSALPTPYLTDPTRKWTVIGETETDP
jgi:hypothetical protein